MREPNNARADHGHIESSALTHHAIDLPAPFPPSFGQPREIGPRLWPGAPAVTKTAAAE
jgi:hypothetical protein